MTQMLWLPAAANRFTPGREVTVDQLIFHTTVGSFDATIRTFQISSRLASAHYVVDEHEDRIALCVRESDRAWHAGNWPVNQRSIGIESVDNSTPAHPRYDEPRSPALYIREAALVAGLARRRPQIPLQLHEDPERPGCLRHRSTVATHCPGTLDVESIIAMARGEIGVFDPRNVPADRDWLDQRIRDVVMSEDIAAFAVYVALGRQTGNLPPRAAKAIADARKRLAARPKTTKRTRRITPAQVRAGHGKG
jgi:hypothetical protein